MPLRVGISPCPNDIYTYAGLLCKEIPNEYTFVIGQIADLNQWAMNGDTDICKVSAGTYPCLKNLYRISVVGASFGTENGPKLVFHKDRCPEDFNSVEIATPGLTTTASCVVKHLFPGIKQVQEDLRKIPELVSRGKYSGAIVINESMGDLARYNLEIKCDLANYWYQKIKTPLPLGLVVLARRLSEAQQERFEADVQESFRWARSNHMKALEIAQAWAAEKDIETIEEHVSSFTVYVEDSKGCKDAISAFMSRVASF